LRKRQEDLRALTLRFLEHYSHRLRKDVLAMSKEAMG
jgi:transcriptional regulator with PAS, ATPase and Fis domain